MFMTMVRLLCAVHYTAVLLNRCLWLDGMVMVMTEVRTGGGNALLFFSFVFYLCISFHYWVWKKFYMYA